MKLTKKQRQSVFQMFGGHCAYCGHKLPEKGWHADHVIAVKRDWEYVRNPKNGMYQTRSTGKLYAPQNDTLENIFPSCRPCNLHKHAMPLEDWREFLSRQAQMCRSYSAPFRHAERFGLVQVIDKPVIFFFESLRTTVA